MPDPGAGDTISAAYELSLDEGNRNLRYGTDERHVGDLYLPTSGTARGVIVAVHGGGFSGGRKEVVTTWFGPILAQTQRGFAVYAINYRLLPETRFPGAVADVSAAVHWLRDNGAEFGVDTSTVIVAGHSAGGTLAALVGTGSNSSAPLGPTAAVDGWITYAAPLDFTTRTETGDYLVRYWRGEKDPSAQNLTYTSPAGHLDPTDPPGYIVHGDADFLIPVSQMDAMLTRAAAVGVRSRLRYDRVDTGAASCRSHEPMCGANQTALNAWIDEVVAGQL